MRQIARVFRVIMLSFSCLSVVCETHRPSSPQMRRITAEWKDIVDAGLDMSARIGRTDVGNGTEPIRLMPHQSNIFEWHFTFAGAPDTDYQHGLFHGKIILPADYPNSAPSVRLLTPNGRFKVNARICLSATEFHQETWNPTWTLRTLVTALRTHMTLPPEEIGSVHASSSARRSRARQSRNWKCPVCLCNHASFPEKLFPLPSGVTMEMNEMNKDANNRSKINCNSMEMPTYGKDFVKPKSLLTSMFNRVKGSQVLVLILLLFTLLIKQHLQ